MMTKRCLYCYKELEQDADFHPSCSKQFFGSATPPRLEYSLEQMNELAKEVVARSISVPGVQPKLSMSLFKEAKNLTHYRLTVVGALGGNYIFKPPSEDFPLMPENEHITMRIAEDFGIRVVPSSLIRLKSGELSYISKRIDREDEKKKIHMLDMFQILEAFDKYRGSMERIGNALGKYSSNTLLDKLSLLEITLFSFLTGNNDMHLKNFSMIHSPVGWVLAPAYDLLNVSILLPEDTEELALTLDGRKKKLTKSHFEKFGSDLGLTEKQVKGVFKRFFRNKSKAFEWLNKSFLPEEYKEKYKKLLEIRYSIIE